MRVIKALLFIVFLELLMRIGGWGFLFQQSLANFTTSANGDYRILCIGESMTAFGGKDSYVLQMQNILNHQQQQYKFSVINRGTPSATTATILSSLKNDLKTYKPQVVVAMLGVNDIKDDDLKLTESKNRHLSILNNISVVKLSESLGNRVLANFQQQIANLKQIAEEFQLKSRLNKDESVENYMALLSFYQRSKNIIGQEQMLIKLLDKHRQNPKAYIQLAVFYQQHEQFQEMKEVLLKLIPILPQDSFDNIIALNLLATAFTQTGQTQAANQIYEQLINLTPGDPNHFMVYVAMAKIALENADDKKAIGIYLIQTQRFGHDGEIFKQILKYYRKNNDKSNLEQFILLANQIAPSLTKHQALVLLETGFWLSDQGNDQESLKYFQQVIDLPMTDIDDMKFTAKKAAIKILKKLDDKNLGEKISHYQLPSEMYFDSTIANYQAIKRMLAQEGVVLVAAQYPLRDVQPLQQILGDGVYYVDNRQGFKEVINKDNYDQYFEDRFAVDFGHATAKGNKIIAQNIANVILNQVLKLGLK